MNPDALVRITGALLHGGVVLGERPLERVEVDLAVGVVVDQHELAAGALLQLQEGDGVGRRTRPG